MCSDSHTQCSLSTCILVYTHPGVYVYTWHHMFIHTYMCSCNSLACPYLHVSGLPDLANKNTRCYMC